MNNISMTPQLQQLAAFAVNYGISNTFVFITKAASCWSQGMDK